MHSNRRGLRRAQAWRWEPPSAEAAVADEDAQQRWNVARAKSIAWAVEVANDARVVYLDTETTGFGPKAEIVDIAVIDSAGDVILESLVQPSRRIPASAIAIHGITNADVRDAPTWCDLYEHLVGVLTGRRIIVYNVIFDRQMVNQSCDRYTLAAPAADWECAMRKYAGFLGNWDAGKRWYRFQKLEQAVLTFGAQPGGHRAAADAVACRAVVHGMASTLAPISEAGEDTAANDPHPVRQFTVDVALAKSHDIADPRSNGTVTAPSSLDVYARWIRAARTFMALLDQIPADLRHRPGACGEWSAREVVAHAAGWEWEAARRLRLIAADPTRPDASYNVNGFNAASVAVRVRQDWTSTIDELTKASNTLAKAASPMLDDRRTQEWLLGRAAEFEEHAAGLQSWLAEVASLPLGAQLQRP